MVTYKPSDEVDFVIIGSGAAGGVLAKELSTNGFRVVVLEQGEYLREKDFTHDETKIFVQSLLTNKVNVHPVTFRKTPEETARKQQAVLYGSCVGGSSVHFTANFWRFHESISRNTARSAIFPAPPLPIGRFPMPTLSPTTRKSSGKSASPASPDRARSIRRARNRIPLPPLPVKGNGVVFERACSKLGYHAYPAPMAILSQPRNRPRCLHELRILPRLRLRGRRKVHVTLQRHSDGRKNRPLRNSPELLCPSHRD